MQTCMVLEVLFMKYFTYLILDQHTRNFHTGSLRGEQGLQG